MIQPSILRWSKEDLYHSSSTAPSFLAVKSSRLREVRTWSWGWRENGSDVSGIGGGIVLDGERAVFGDAEITGGVEMAGEDLGGAVEREKGELGVALVLRK